MNTCTRTVIETYLVPKMPFLKLSLSRVVYEFSCASCSTCYVGEINRPLATRACEHLTSDKISYIFQHIYGPETCRALCSENCLSILDKAIRNMFSKLETVCFYLKVMFYFENSRDSSFTCKTDQLKLNVLQY